jgi:hypothetical protein
MIELRRTMTDDEGQPIPVLVEFQDHDGKSWVIAQSSKSPGWMVIGCGTNATGWAYARMRPEVAAILWPFLKAFAETGRLPAPPGVS